MIDIGFLPLSFIVIVIPSMIIAMFIDESDLYNVPRLILPVKYRWFNPRISKIGSIYCCIISFLFLLIWASNLSAYAVLSTTGLLELSILIVVMGTEFNVGNAVGYYLRPYTEDYRWRGRDSWHDPSPWID